MEKLVIYIFNNQFNKKEGSFRKQAAINCVDQI